MAALLFRLTYAVIPLQNLDRSSFYGRSAVTF